MKDNVKLPALVCMLLFAAFLLGYMLGAGYPPFSNDEQAVNVCEGDGFC